MFAHILLNLLLQSKLGSFLEQAFYPGGERGKSVNVEASINRVVTETGAELSIIKVRAGLIRSSYSICSGKESTL